MKIRCACGNVIVDQTDDLPFKARVTPDKVEFALAEIAAQNIALLIEACVNGRREAFIAEHFGPDYPKDLDNESIVLDLMPSLASKHVLSMYQCPACGRLLLNDRQQPSQMLFFAPEHDIRDALDVAESSP